ncbi:hypothetical protein U1Q18_028770 [Sarracenia purpurea var. burkii]
MGVCLGLALFCCLAVHCLLFTVWGLITDGLVFILVGCWCWGDLSWDVPAMVGPIMGICLGLALLCCLAVHCFPLLQVNANAMACFFVIRLLIWPSLVAFSGVVDFPR